MPEYSVTAVTKPPKTAANNVFNANVPSKRKSAYSQKNEKRYKLQPIK